MINPDRALTNTSDTPLPLIGLLLSLPAGGAVLEKACELFFLLEENTSFASHSFVVKPPPSPR